MTALTAFLTSTAATTLTTANTIVTTAPSSETSVAVATVPKSTGWVELTSQAGSVTTLGASEPASPTGTPRAGDWGHSQT